MTSSTVQTVGLLLSTWLLWSVFHRFVTKSPLDRLRGPRPGSILFGNFPQLFNFRGWKFHHDIAEYGGVVKIQGGLGKRLLYVYDPTVLYHVLVKDQYIFTKAFGATGKQSALIFGRGLLSTFGEQHKKQRRLMNPVFSIAHMKYMVLQFYTVCHKLSDALTNELAGPEKEIDILMWMTRAALELIGQAGLGYSFDPLTEDIHNEFAEAMKSLVPALSPLTVFRDFTPIFFRVPGMRGFYRRILPYVPSRRIQNIRKIVNTMHDNCTQVYEEKKRALQEGDNAVMQQIGRGKDIMSILLKANLEASEEERLPEEEVIAQMTTLVFAATDTTTNALSRILFLLSEHPDVQNKLRSEIKQAKSGREGDLTYEELESLRFMDAICRETLRLHAPVSTLIRTATKDAVLPLKTPITAADGSRLTEIVVPKGTDILISLRSLNRSKQYWGEDALEWKPERWLKPLPDELIDAHVPGIYSNLMTFSGGAFSCIGFKFSQLEMKVVLALLIERFTFSLPEKTKIQWNMGGIQFPTVEGSTQPRMLLKMRLVE